MGPVHVIDNADVRTLDERSGVTDAIAWQDGRILALGDDVESIRADTRWDAGGVTVLPGFVDAHHHPCLSALWGGADSPRSPSGHRHRWPPSGARRSRDGPPARSLARRHGLGRARARGAAASDARRAECCRPRPAGPCDALFVSSRGGQQSSPRARGHLAGHGGSVGGRDLAGQERSARRPLDRARHEPSGRAFPSEPRCARCRGIHPTPGRASPRPRRRRHHPRRRRSRAVRLARGLPRGGRTRCGDRAHRADAGLDPGYLEEPWDALDGPTTGETEGVLTFGPVKLVFDGAPGCAMCLGIWQVLGVFGRAWLEAFRTRTLDVVRVALSVEPRVGRDLRVRTGIAIYGHDEARRIVAAAAEWGFALATHAIGNDAVDVVLGAYEATPAVHRAGIPRIEHATLLDRALVSRIAGVGAAVVAQPHMVTLPAFANAPAIPAVRNMPLRWLLDAGARVAGSSDYPVAGFDPLDAIRAAVTRDTGRGRQLEPDQCVDLDEALTMYTRTAAEVSGCLDDCGTLEVGRRADLVVLDRTLSLQTLEGAKVRQTVIGGQVVFGNGALGRHPC